MLASESGAVYVHSLECPVPARGRQVDAEGGAAVVGETWDDSVEVLAASSEGEARLVIEGISVWRCVWSHGNCQAEEVARVVAQEGVVRTDVGAPAGGALVVSRGCHARADAEEDGYFVVYLQVPPGVDSCDVAIHDLKFTGWEGVVDVLSPQFLEVEIPELISADWGLSTERDACRARAYFEDLAANGDHGLSLAAARWARALPRCEGDLSLSAEDFRAWDSWVGGPLPPEVRKPDKVLVDAPL